MLTKIKFTPIFLVAILFISSCKNDTEQNEVYVAEVGYSRLTEKELNSVLEKDKSNPKYQKEYIKNWIETEVLNQVALEKDLLKDENYNLVLKQSAKELASTYAIDEYLKNKSFSFSDKELVKYFNDSKNDFQTNTDAYVVNIISFAEETKAISFRNRGIVDGWNKAVEFFNNDSSIVEVGNRRVYKDYHVQSKVLLRILRGQRSKEISPVIKTELNNFVVVQQIDKIKKNSVPKFKYVKDKLKERYIIQKQKELVKQYIDSLITEKNVKIY